MVISDNFDQEANNTSKRKISIIESGFNCKRGLNVNTFGMPLTKQSKYKQFNITFYIDT